MVQKFGIEAVKGLDTLQDQKVRNAGAELNIGQRFNRAAIKVRGHLGIEGLGHARDLLGFQDAADPPRGRLQNAGGLSFQHPLEFVLGRQAFASCDRNAGLAGNARHFFGRFGRGWLFEPQRIKGLDRLGQTNSATRGELAVGAEQKVGLVTDGLSNLAQEIHRALDIVQAGHVGVGDGVGARRVEFDRGETLSDVLGSLLGVGVRVRPKAGIAFALGAGIEIGVGARALSYLAAQQVVDWLTGCLANDIPHGDLKARHHAHQGHIRSSDIARRIGPPPKQLDLEGISTLKVALKGILDTSNSGVGAKGVGIDFAIADDAVAGHQLDEDEVAAAPTRRWRRDDKGFKLLNFHGSFPLVPKSGLMLQALLGVSQTTPHCAASGLGAHHPAPR